MLRAPEPVSLQLQWFTQAQFAGYFAAKDKGFYEDEGLDVTILEGGVDIVPAARARQRRRRLRARVGAQGLAIARGRRGHRQHRPDLPALGHVPGVVRGQGHHDADDFAGKKVGNWGFGNEYEIFAAIAPGRTRPGDRRRARQQHFDMVALLDGDIDAAEAMTYNEYAQVLETVNPDTGELYTPEDLNVISYEEIGVGMLQDAIWADAERLGRRPPYKDIAVRFLRGHRCAGWTYCRDNVEECVDIVVAARLRRSATSHQLWQMNEINKLIWPSPDGIGYINQAAWDRTVEIARTPRTSMARPS